MNVEDFGPHTIANEKKNTTRNSKITASGVEFVDSKVPVDTRGGN